MSNDSTDLTIDPGGVWICYKGTTYWRDGVVYGQHLEHADPFELPLDPTLWSYIVAQYELKHTKVEAIQLTHKNVEEVTTWCGGEFARDGHGALVRIPTLDGVVYAIEGDYVIKDHANRFSALNEQDFNQKYNPA